ncbi:MAG: DUF3108 domain-containing protein [Bacteroidales bacterium]|nr:DUF3108 domain-containing protein [Bacteroidales bacterium]
MKKLFVLIIALVLTGNLMPAFAVSEAKSSQKVEELHYDAYWHWGFIWKKAGSGILRLWDEELNDNSHRMHGQLAGRSHSIVETIMKVRDTLDCWYTPEIIPLEYSKKTHEGSYHAIERNYYKSFADGKWVKNATDLTEAKIDSTQTDIYRWRVKKGNDRRHKSTVGVGYDMLSIFYKIRQLDFDKMKKGDKLKFYICAGVRGQYMTLNYQGKTTCTLKNGKQYPSHQILLTFASKDSDSTPLQVWLAQTPDHRPLSVIIQLKRIGSIQGEIVE